MKLEVIAYADLVSPSASLAHGRLQRALLETGIVGISDVPDFEKQSSAYVHAARAFRFQKSQNCAKISPSRSTLKI